VRPVATAATPRISDSSAGARRSHPAPHPRSRIGIGTAIDAFGGSFTMPYTALVVIAERTGAG